MPMLQAATPLRDFWRERQLHGGSAGRQISTNDPGWLNPARSGLEAHLEFHASLSNQVETELPMVSARGIVFESVALQKRHLFRYRPSHARLAFSRPGPWEHVGNAR